MAVIGQQLVTPQAGWKRFNATSSAISYVGAWEKFETTIASYQFTDNVGMFSITPNNTMKFNFTGRKLLLKAYGNNDTSGFLLTIDGVNQGNIKTAYSVISTIVVYEKVDLDDREHNVEIKLLPYTSVSGATRTRLLFDSIDIDQDRDLRIVRSVVGSQLTTPENGWKRYDDNISSIKYVGSFTNGAGTGAYNGYSNYTSTLGDKIVFDFEGSKLRLIGARYTNRSDLIEVYVDGKLHGTHSQLGSELAQVLQVEIVGLPKSRHRVEMVNKSSGLTTTYMALDAIDIDLDGRLFHPDEVASITELEIGKRIRCNYVVNTAGVAGEFKNIGEETSDFISTISIPSAPNGDFYFIVVDEYNKKKILIADRPIQAAISWDALNSNGLVFGVQKDLGVKNYMFVARLLSGGYSATDKHNEWDQYIVNSTLNGNIIVGDDRVWNWSAGYSLTSTTNANSANRVRRGYATASTSGSIPASTANGYRPLVELETLPMFKSFVKHDGAYKRLDTGTLEWNTISATLPSEDTFINEGMDDLSVLDRKNEVFVQAMISNGSLGSGKLFKGSIDLKKYFEIKSLSVK